MKLVIIFLIFSGCCFESFTQVDECYSHYEIISHIKFEFDESDKTCAGELKIMEFFRQGQLERVKVRLRNFKDFWDFEDFGTLNINVQKCVISTRIRAMDNMRLDLSCKKKIKGWIRHNIEYFGIEYGL